MEQTERIRHEIEVTKADLDERLARIAEKAERALDVGAYLGARPWATVATGAAVGFVLGLGGGNGHPRHAADPDRRRVGPDGVAVASRLLAQAVGPAIDVVTGAAMMALAGLMRDAVGRKARGGEPEVRPAEENGR
jgi:hypothetical protein